MISLLRGRDESQQGSCFLFVENLPRKVLNEEGVGSLDRHHSSAVMEDEEVLACWGTWAQALSTASPALWAEGPNGMHLRKQSPWST